jgi:hypothetical protein
MPIFKQIRDEDTTTETFITTHGFFDGGVGQLAGSSLASSSLSAAQKEYYINLQYNSKDHLSIAYGNFHGSGSVDTVGQTKAVYKQFANILLDPSQQGDDTVTPGFVFSGSVNSTNRENDVFFVTAERLQMRDSLNKKNWTLQLTGSNSAGNAGITLHLTDNSAYEVHEPTPAGVRFNIISGSAGNRGNNPLSTIFGHFYPEVGVLALNGSQLSASLPGVHSSGLTSKTGFGLLNRSTNAASPGISNTLKLMDCMCTAGDASGRATNITHQFRSEEKITTNAYFCRARAEEFNYSNNPTFTSGSQNVFSNPDYATNPTTFITEVGLYNANQQLQAVAKLSSPIEKNFSSEAVIKVNLDY